MYLCQVKYVIEMLTKKTKIVVCMNWVYKMWEI